MPTNQYVTSNNERLTPTTHYIDPPSQQSTVAPTESTENPKTKMENKTNYMSGNDDDITPESLKNVLKKIRATSSNPPRSGRSSTASSRRSSIDISSEHDDHELIQVKLSQSDLLDTGSEKSSRIKDWNPNMRANNRLSLPRDDMINSVGSSSGSSAGGTHIRPLTLSDVPHRKGLQKGAPNSASVPSIVYNAHNPTISASRKRMLSLFVLTSFVQ